MRRKFSGVLACLILTLPHAGIGFCDSGNRSQNPFLFAPPEISQAASPDRGNIAAADKARLRLAGEVRRLASMAGGTLGVSAVHVESGRSFSQNGLERFPMASAYKIPIAVQLLMRVDRGEIALDQAVTLRKCDIHPGSGKLISSYKKTPMTRTVKELLELMLLVSDNSASDALLKLAGGPKAVTETLKSLGIVDLEVSRSTLDMLADWRGIETLPSHEDFTVDQYNRMRDKVPSSSVVTAQQRFYSDLRDSSTPEAMTALLAGVYRGDVLKPESSVLLFELMERCQTGKSRIKNLVPPGMATANKTGTIGKGIVNDVALMTLPENTGHVALAIFIKGSDRSVAKQEQVMAQIARYCYDYYFFIDGGFAMAAHPPPFLERNPDAPAENRDKGSYVP